MVPYVCPCLLPIRNKGTNPVSLTVGAVMGPGHLEEAGRIDDIWRVGGTVKAARSSE